MNDEALNMSIRKFLKTVGVNSQLAIEKAVRKAIEDGKLAGNESFPATFRKHCETSVLSGLISARCSPAPSIAESLRIVSRRC